VFDNRQSGGGWGKGRFACTARQRGFTQSSVHDLSNAAMPHRLNPLQAFALGCLVSATFAPAHAAEPILPAPEYSRYQKELDITVQQLRLELDLQEANPKWGSESDIKGLSSRARNLYENLTMGPKHCFD
jgi:hypothetical protein